jgi:hypothetical protein
MQLRPVLVYKRRALTHAVSRLSLTTDTRVWSQISPLEFCGGQSGAGTSFSPTLYFCFLLSASLHQSSTLIFIDMLLSPEGQGGEDCERSKKKKC